MTKFRIILLIIVTQSIALYGQNTEVYIYSGRQLVEGAKNNIKILKADSLQIEVSVSNGKIEKGEISSMIFRNKEMLSLKDSVYFWAICEASNGFEKLYINYFRNNQMIKSDTILFYTKKGPIVSAKVKSKDESIKSLKPADIERIDLVGTSLEYGFKHTIKSFKIEIFNKNKILKTLENSGSKLSEQNKKAISSYKKGYLKINSIDAILDCGLELKVKDIEPIYY